MTTLDTSDLEADQERLLDCALHVVKTESFEMKRCLDKNELMDGLRHASIMLSELRTSFLTPIPYSKLYMDATNELQHFLSYLTDNYLDTNKTRKVFDLYEMVQYTGNIIPRLYLLITVGVIYIKSGEASTKDVFFDLVEMCRGVQHPLRGLFLRNYLLSLTKEFLPDLPSTSIDSDDSNSNGHIKDAIEFIMINFSEMNKLWVRMQHLGPSKERSKREKERRELKVLVGTNLIRLSQLENLTLDMYEKIVLPGILEQSVSCKEPISQEYLMECVIELFPENFHLHTLNKFLDACADLHPDVHIKNILVTLIGRLRRYTAPENFPDSSSNVQLFETFSHHIKLVFESRDVPVEDIISIQIELLNLALCYYKENTEYTNTVFESTANILKKTNVSNLSINSVIGRKLLELLNLPYQYYSNIDAFLQLTNYKNVLSFFDFSGRIFVCSLLIKSILENEIQFDNEKKIDSFFNIIDSLIIDQSDQPNGLIDEIKDGQELVAKLIHLIYNDDVEKHFKLINKICKIFVQGGKIRLRYTLPSIIFVTFKLMFKFYENKEMENFDEKINKIFHFCMNTINTLKVQAEMSEFALRFYLQGALIANKIYFEKSAEVAYEFISSAFTIYEEDISESKEQVQALSLLIATIQQITYLTDDSHEPLRNQCALFATKLIKRPDQVRLVCLAARLFWFSKVINNDDYIRDGQRVFECLKKAIKIASQCMEDIVQITLYIHILTDFFYFYEENCDSITFEVINSLIDKIRDSLMQLDPSAESDNLNDTFKNLLQRIRTYQKNPPSDCILSFEQFVL